jgi:WD40 repeat protein
VISNITKAPGKKNRMFIRSKFHIATMALGVVFLVGSSPVLAGLFAGSKTDVATKVAELPGKRGEDLFPGLAFSPDGSRIAIDQSEIIKIWDWRSRHVVQTLNKVYGGNDLSVSNPVLFSPDENFVANCEVSGEGDVALRIWNATSGSIVKDVTASSGTPSPSGCAGIVFTPNGQILIRIADTVKKPGNNLIVFSSDTWEPIWGLSLAPFFAAASVATNPNGTLAAVAGIRTIAGDHDVVHDLQIYIIDMSQRKAVTGGAGNVQIFDAESGATIVSVKYDQGTHMNNRFTPDGRYFIETDANGQGTGLGAKIWDSRHQTLLQTIRGNVSSIDVSRDSKHLALGLGNKVLIYELK